MAEEGIDLNADLGEGYGAYDGNYEGILRYVTSANVAVVFTQATRR